jgi:hypothetical protein
MHRSRPWRPVGIAETVECFPLSQVGRLPEGTQGRILFPYKPSVNEMDRNATKWTAEAGILAG